MRCAIATLVWLCLTTAASAQAVEQGSEPALELILPDGSVSIGWFDVVVHGQLGEDASLTIDPLPADMLVGHSTRRRLLGRDELRLPVGTFRAGDLILDGVTIVDGDRRTVLDAATVVVVEQEPVGTVAKVSELLDSLDLPLPPADLLGFAALLVGSMLALWIYIVRTSRVVVAVVYVPPPDHVAIEALDKLRLSMPRTSEQVLVFIVAISDVLRCYVEGRFELHAPARTTEEFLLEAASADSGLADRTDALEQFLTQCDLVKYARHRPSPDEALVMLNSAGTFVEETR
jgi:hypothetical protein